MLKQSLQQKLLQKLSPQQIQTIKLLEIPTMQLEERIKNELEENPLLEEGKESEDEFEAEKEEEIPDKKEEVEFSLDDYKSDDEIPYYKLSTKNYSKDDKNESIPFSIGSTFHNYLESQLGLRHLTEKQRIIATYILGNIDDDGYLRREIEAIADDVAFLQNIPASEEEIQEVLNIIQDFDPVGVGARNLQECLLLQVERKKTELPGLQLAEKILNESFTEFTKKHYDKIIARYAISEQELKVAIDEILKLNPKPGSSYSDPFNKTSQHIIPDFMMDINDGKPELSLNSKNVPDLRINRTYTNMLEDLSRRKKALLKTDKEAIGFVKQKIDAAKWFIDSIKQRQQTLMLTMTAIIEFQREYFIEGDETKLRPMILKDIAETTGLDVSTISRVANSKYIQTHFGIYPLKFFFSEGLQTDSGEEVSTREIKKILQDCIENEKKRRPLTDDKLAVILQEKGYQIARRTVAKYREQLNIPVARLRKEL